MELTREELYELVWTVPMQRLAERYWISDVSLAETCGKLVIPVPPRGYWRRKETGRVPARPALPRPRPGGRATVTLSVGRKREPPPLSPELAARAAHEALPENRILVADRLSRPHPLVREAAAVLRPRSRGVDSVRPWRIDRCLDIRVTPKHLGRALRIFDALVKALDARGIPISVITNDRRRHTQVELYGETVAFWLKERTTPRIRTCRPKWRRRMARPDGHPQRAAWLGLRVPPQELGGQVSSKLTNGRIWPPARSLKCTAHGAGPRTGAPGPSSSCLPTNCPGWRRSRTSAPSFGSLRSPPRAPRGGCGLRFISAEPFLGPLTGLTLGGVSWVITGRESGGPPERALIETTKREVRPKPEGLRRAREIRDECRVEGVAFFQQR